MMQNKGAIELSMTTVVIIVLAMTMLILGLVLVRTIFQGATYNVQSINDKVRAEINKLFTEEEQAIVVYLPELKATMKMGDTFAVAFAFRDPDRTGGTFSYSIQADNPSTACGITKTEAERFISAGKTGSITVAGGESWYGLVRFQPTKATPKGCILRYNIVIGQRSAFFDVEITGR